MNEEVLTQEYLKEALNYNPETGKFTWRLNRPDSHFKDWRGKNGFYSNINPSLEAGSLSRVTKRNPSPYIVIGLGGKLYKAHRLAWFYVNGEWPPEDIDHIDLNTQNNAISNLQLSIDKLNHRNRSKYSNNSSGVVGVSFHKKTGKWQAEGQEIVDGKRVRHYLGLFKNLEDAANARKDWEVKYGYSENHGKEISR